MRASAEQIVEARVEELTARISELEQMLQESEAGLAQAQRENRECQLQQTGLAERLQQATESRNWWREIYKSACEEFARGSVRRRPTSAVESPKGA